MKESYQEFHLCSRFVDRVVSVEKLVPMKKLSAYLYQNNWAGPLKMNEGRQSRSVKSMHDIQNGCFTNRKQFVNHATYNQSLKSIETLIFLRNCSKSNSLAPEDLRHNCVMPVSLQDFFISYTNLHQSFENT